MFERVDARADGIARARRPVTMNRDFFSERVRSVASGNASIPGGAEVIDLSQYTGVASTAAFTSSNVKV